MLDLELAANVPWKRIANDAKAATLWAKSAPIADLERAITAAKNSYYNSENALVSDRVYDSLEDTLRARAPRSRALAVGAPVQNKTRLPLYMGSLDKVKDEGALDRWLERNDTDSYLVADKLDGISFLYVNDGERRLYTRGDGTYGKDISAFIDALDLPAIRSGTQVRGELIMSAARFDTLWSRHFANARAAVSGVTNRKDIHDALANIDAIAYELVGKRTPEQQLAELRRLGFKTVPHRVVKSLDFDTLAKMYSARRDKSRYAIDGLVVTANRANTRNTSGNPGYSFAFKSNSIDDAPVVTVKDVLWRESRHGRLKPRVEIEPTVMQGVTVTYVTAHNARYVFENRIGPGATLRVVRSGEVIPYIVEVVKPARAARMPEVPYTWSGVDAVVKNATDEGAIRRAEHFFSSLGVEGFKYASVRAMFEAGYTLETLLETANEEYERVLGKNGRKIAESIDRVLDSGVPLDTLMSASGLFRGLSTRFTRLVETIPDVMTAPKSSVIERLAEIPDWGPSSTAEFTARFPEFRAFVRRTGIRWYVPKPKRVVKNGALSGQRVLFTGFRDSELVSAIERLGGETVSGISSKTTLVLAPSGVSNNKTVRAAELDIPVMTPEQFRKRYRV